MATLKRLSVKNYRCLADVDVPLESLTAFVGPNGAGKTSLLRVFDIILGDARLTTLHSFCVSQDFIAFKSSNYIENKVEFDFTILL